MDINTSFKLVPVHKKFIKGSEQKTKNETLE